MSCRSRTLYVRREAVAAIWVWGEAAGLCTSERTEHAELIWDGAGRAPRPRTQRPHGRAGRDWARVSSEPVEKHAAILARAAESGELRRDARGR